MIVRVLLWGLAESKTTLDEIRARLEQSANRTWISNEATDRFGVIETWDGEPGDFPLDLVALIGREPDIAEEFDAERPWKHH